MKHNKLKYFLLSGMLCLLANPAKSQRIRSVLDKFPLAINEHLSLLPAPSLSYKPETNLSFGLALIGIYSPGTDRAKDISTAQLDIVYTLNNQVIIDLDHYILLQQGNWLFYGSNSFYQYPELYYSSSNEDEAEDIEYKRLEFDNKIFFKIRDHWYVGLVHRLQHIGSMEFAPSGNFSSEKPTGYLGGLAHGIGFGTLIDLRGNVLNPQNGEAYFSLNSGLFSGKFGSQFEFVRVELDFRKYWRLGENHTMAIQGLGVFNTGDPPFKLTGQLGGSQIMRAYYLGRFRNRQMLAFQAELRLKVYKGFGMTTFASIGNTSCKFSRLIDQAPLAGYGIGLRFMLNKKNRANLRLDYAMGKHSHGIYFGYGEAF